MQGPLIRRESDSRVYPDPGWVFRLGDIVTCFVLPLTSCASVARSPLARRQHARVGLPGCTALVRPGRSPALGQASNLASVPRPVVEHGGVEVRARGPDEGVDLGGRRIIKKKKSEFQRAGDDSCAKVNE